MKIPAPGKGLTGEGGRSKRTARAVRVNILFLHLHLWVGTVPAIDRVQCWFHLRIPKDSHLSREGEGNGTLILTFRLQEGNNMCYPRKKYLTVFFGATTSCICIQSPCAVADAGSARMAGETANSTKEQAWEVFMELMLKITGLTIPWLSALSCSVYVFVFINHCWGMT